MQEEFIENEKIIINEIELKHSEEIHRSKVESAERERKLLNEYMREHHARSLVLVMALLKIKSGRDRIFLAVSWIAVGAIALISFRGHMHEPVSMVFMLAALAGFIGAIIFLRQNLKRNSGHLKSAAEGTLPSDSIWEEDDGKSSRFLIFGLISAVLLGAALFINVVQKVSVLPQTSGSSDQKPVTVQAPTTAVAEAQGVVTSAAPAPAPVPVESNGQAASAVTSTSAGTSPAVTDTKESTVKPTGNGGNFASGNTR